MFCFVLYDNIIHAFIKILSYQYYYLYIATTNGHIIKLTLHIYRGTTLKIINHKYGRTHLLYSSYEFVFSWVHVDITSMMCISSFMSSRVDKKGVKPHYAILVNNLDQFVIYVIRQALTCKTTVHTSRMINVLVYTLTYRCGS